MRITELLTTIALIIHLLIIEYLSITIKIIIEILIIKIIKIKRIHSKRKKTSRITMIIFLFPKKILIYKTIIQIV
jgi:hypothetical protein